MNGHLERIRAFLAVANEGGFAAAARKLDTSPSSVTRAVADLEDALGVQLFVRTTRRVSLTQTGQTYHQRVGPLLAELGRADDQARVAQTALVGQLRISAPLSFGTTFLSGPITSFRSAHPGVALSVNLTDRFVDIMTSELDMALRISGPPSDRSTIWRKIKPVRRSLVASPGYLRANGVPRHPDDLPRHRCLSYTHLAEGETWLLTDRDSRVTRPIRLNFEISSNNGDLLAQLAAQDQGIALLPDFLTAKDRAAGALVPLLTDWTPPEIWLTAFYPPYQKLPPAVARFTDIFEDAARTLPI